MSDYYGYQVGNGVDPPWYKEVVSRKSRRDMRRRIRHLPEATIAPAVCPSCHLPRVHFRRDRLGQLVCLVCRR